MPVVGDSEMCGICGIAFGDSCKTDLMLSTILHRGPDAHDVWRDETTGLGHARLSIIDLSETGNQPMVSPDGNIVMVYNGEIYNFAELRQELEELGHRFAGHSDSEVLLHAFWEYGNAVFSRLNGMFAAAFWDRKRRVLTLARDRFGIKPLYYSIDSNGTLLFGSEIKALLAVDSSLRRLDHTGLIEFLCFQNPLGENTLYERIKYLLPGHILEYDGKNTVVSEYWSPLDVAAIDDTEADAIVRTRELLQGAVRSHLVADVPIGVFLSGGIDSSAIAMIGGQELGRDFSTFSVEFDDGRHSELSQARSVAELAGTTHHEMKVSCSDLRNTLAKLTIAHDQPFGDAANLPLYLLAETVSSSVKVVLQGDGGDEIFGGYDYYANHERYRATRRSLGSASDWVYSVGRRLSPHPRIRRRLEATFAPQAYVRHVNCMSQYINGFPLRIFSPETREKLSEITPDSRYREMNERIPPEIDDLQRCLLLDQTILLPDKFLEKVDKPTMAHSLEVRIPFLDAPLTEYVIGLRSNLKIQRGQKKYILRQALRGIVPDSVLDAPKRGFDIPITQWVRGPLSSDIRDVLNSDAVRDSGLFNPKALSSYVESGLRPRSMKTLFVWHLFRLAEWLETYDIQAA